MYFSEIQTSRIFLLAVCLFVGETSAVCSGQASKGNRLVQGTPPCPYGRQRSRPSTISPQPRELSDEDVHRGTLRAPENPRVLANPEESVAEVLNTWMLANVPRRALKLCTEFSLEELNSVIASIVQAAHPDLNIVYKARCVMYGKCDSRMLRHDNLTAYETEWEEEQIFLAKLPLLARDMVRDGKCFEVMSMFYHHLPEHSRFDAVELGVKLPLLPVAAPMSIEENRLHRLHRRSFRSGHAETVRVTVDTGALAALWQYRTTLEASIGTSEWNRLVATYSSQATCQTSHVNSLPNVFAEDTEYLGDYNESANTTITGTGYRGSGHPQTCSATCGVDDSEMDTNSRIKKYHIQAKNRHDGISIPGTEAINPTKNTYKFVTRTFEPMPGRKNSKFWEGNQGNGSGNVGILGPAMMVDPGDTLYMLVKNKLVGDLHNLPVDGTKTLERINVIRAEKIRGSTFGGGGGGYIRTYNTSVKVPEWFPSLFDGPVVSADALIMLGGTPNVPGNFTNGFNKFNIHLHGFETQPHLFHPLGTSYAKAPWIQIEPDDCYCYKFEISTNMSRGLFLYHTHMHGTTTMLSWAGLFGVFIVGEMSVTQARSDLAAVPPISETKYSLVHDLVKFTDGQNISFTNSDMIEFVMYNTNWGQSLCNDTNTDDGDDIDVDKVYLSDFIYAMRGNACNVTTLTSIPVLVNNEYQPRFNAALGHLTVFNIACIAANDLCAFQIVRKVNTSTLDGGPTTTLVEEDLGFYRLASDGISYERPIRRNPSIDANTYLPDVSPAEMAYLSMGGGMRETVALVFPAPGEYFVYQRSTAFDDGSEQLVATITVASTGSTVNTTNIGLENITLKSGRSTSDVLARNVTRTRDLTFATNYSQDGIPFVQYGVSTNETGFQMYDVNASTMAANGRECEEWIIRSSNVFTHPFHIHVNPFLVLESNSTFQAQEGIKSIWPFYHWPWVSIKNGGTAQDVVWRDTVMVPPFGYVRIKQCYDAFTPKWDGTINETFGGKFIFHCHFLAHEDTGLMHNFMLTSTKVPNGVATADVLGSSGLAPEEIVGIVLGSVVVVVGIVAIVFRGQRSSHQPHQPHQPQEQQQQPPPPQPLTVSVTKV
eukprot:m.91988 g.91988  ORF g.91988 m.91988 type:complete len:1106 (+) comp26516_c0_seq2:169-3486(+)